MRNILFIPLVLLLSAGCGKPAAEPVARVDADRTGWRKLAKGMTQDKVRQLLGDPMKVENEGGVTCWRYQEGRPLERNASDPSKWIIARGALLFSDSSNGALLTAWREP